MSPELPDLHGRTWIITGGSGGLGLAAAHQLAARGARLILACRDPKRGEQARVGILAQHPQVQVDVELLDLASLSSVRACAGRLASHHGRIGALINNAGIMSTPYAVTEDGFEQQIAVNHLGHFALTGLLMSRLAADGARIVHVSSIMHKQPALSFDDLRGRQGYSPRRAYSRSKLANLLFHFELSRRLQGHASGCISVACHPGYSDTALQGTAARSQGRKTLALLYGLGGRLLAQTPDSGAWPLVFAAASPEARAGGYYGPTGPFELRGPLGEAQATAAARDELAARRLWEESCRATGVNFPALNLGGRPSPPILYPESP